MNWMEVTPVILYVIFSCTGLCFMKSGNSSGTGIFVYHYFISYKTLAGMLCYGISFLIYSFVVSKSQISILIPLLAAVNSCIIVLMGLLLFKERMNTGQTVGIAIVVVGTVIIGYFSRK